jgi:hypothetical protein
MTFQRSFFFATHVFLCCGVGVNVCFGANVLVCWCVDVDALVCACGVGALHGYFLGKRFNAQGDITQQGRYDNGEFVG